MTGTLVTHKNFDVRRIVGDPPKMDLGPLQRDLMARMKSNCGLAHNIDAGQDPTYPSPAVLVKNRGQHGSPARASASRAPAIVSAHADFNSKPVFDFSGLAQSSDMVIDGSGHTASVTMIFVGKRATGGHAIATELRDVNGSPGYRQVFRTAATDTRIFFGNHGGAAGTINLVPLANLPDPNVPAVYAVSYHNLTRISNIYVNSAAAPVSTFTHPSASNVDNSARYCIGGAGGAVTTLGWGTQMTNPFIFNLALHVLNLSLLTYYMDRLRQEYGITG